jgi:hypothetical protein
MRNGLLLAFALATAVVACRKDLPPPTKSPEDAGAPGDPDSAALPTADGPAADARDASLPDEGRDSALDGPPEPPHSDAAVADAADAAALHDAATVDTTTVDADRADAAVATCGPAVPRAMLCTTYCQGMATLCTGGEAQYPGAEQCRAACNGAAWGCGKEGDFTGNSLFCRLAHMALAGVGSAATECPNAGPGSPACR